MDHWFIDTFKNSD